METQKHRVCANMGRISILGATLWPVGIQDEGGLVESSSVGESHRHALPEPNLSLSAYQTLSTDEGFQG